DAKTPLVPASGIKVTTRLRIEEAKIEGIKSATKRDFFGLFVRSIIQREADDKRAPGKRTVFLKSEATE
ncbi:MAG TPA: hypothetical protein PLP59_13140, partial [Thermotogota bacterium]|nr:hypothetical protein [Thermotogota bacterium]